jgi:putative glutamine amidotransferase
MRSENKKDPIIGITMCLDDYGMVHEGITYSLIRREYGLEVRSAGGQPIFIDSSIDPEIAAKMCDGIIISGGQDIDPSFYGQEQAGVGIVEPIERTLWERRLIDACDQAGKPILGVCYGMQLLNVHYGVTLHQDIYDEGVTDRSHGESTNPASHRVKFQRDFLSFQQDDQVTTVHRHHQAVDKLARGFSIAATAEDGVIEAITGRGHIGIQWHTEADGTAGPIYGAFVASCAGPGLERAVRPLPEAA